MSDVIEPFLVMIGCDEPQTLPLSLPPPNPNSAWSSSEWVFAKQPQRWNALQNVQWDVSQLLPRLVSQQRRSLAQRKVA